ncbi:MAG: PQQ-dependent sugar dehydrogenase [Acidobacteria bacterium]|nr:PQQ-dependent sugar dehydrogenase [Acidobacteriota bacterium]
MPKFKHSLLLLILLLAVKSSFGQAPAELKAPEGFKVTVFASGVTGGRLMAISPDGVLYVARQPQGDVVALPDRDMDGKADAVEVVASGLTRPHSVAFNNGYLYIATNPAILRVKYANGKVDGKPEKIIDLPISTTPHFTRSIGFDKNGKLYVSIGSSCNSCEEEDARRTTIMQYNADGTGGKPFAKGLRNAIGFDWDPSTGAMWSTDMGQDKLGEEMPCDEINRIQAGKHYGFPYFICNNVANPDLKDAKGKMDVKDAVPPAFELPAHSSPIGLTFYKGKNFPAAYRNAMFVAIHGSSPTARKEKIGYNVIRVIIKNGKPAGTEVFVSGWLKDGAVLGRPAGLITGADGALYISDDNKGFVYKVSYSK